MAIHPIDLQTMYTQMDSIARNVANQQQGVQLSQQLQENGKIQKMAEQAAMVHKTADDQAKSLNVKDESQKKSEGQKKGKEKDETEEEKQKPKENEIRESYLGQHINITR
jgi:hypothetical protein